MCRYLGGMPLPKSSSIAAKATEVYSEVWSVILQQLWSMPPSRNDDLSDLSCLLPYLRQLLTCCACAGLLEDAMISLSCGHCYCCECQFRDPLLKIQCRQCRERTGLVVESQLRILVKCYRHMCSILAARVGESPTLLKQLSSLGSDNSESSVITSTPADDSEDTMSRKNEMATKNEKKVASAPPVVTDPDFNPIFEILREIQEGVKVSRAVLVIKPPSKYLNVKVTVTPKKEQQSLPSTVTGPRSTPKCTSNLTTQLSAEKHNTPHDSDALDVRVSASSTRSSGLRGKRRHSKKSLCSKHRNSFGEQSPLLVKKRHCDNDQEDKKRGDRSGASTEEEEVDILSVNEVTPHRATEKELTERKLELDCFQPDVSLSCFDEQYLDVSSNRVTLKPNEDSDFKISAPVNEGQLTFRMTVDGNRERLWSHLCPKVRVKRSRATIDRTYHHQIKAAKGMARTQSMIPKTPEIYQPPIPIPQSEDRTLPAEFEQTLPKDITEILEELESENPYPLDRSYFHSPPLFPPPFCPMPPPPSACQPPMFGPLHQQPNYPIVVSTVPLKHPYSPQIVKTPTTPKKRRTPGYSEEGWRCRCGTNNVMFPEKVCAKGKCPCFSKGIPCKNCLCRQCHNPNNQ